MRWGLALLLLGCADRPLYLSTGAGNGTNGSTGSTNGGTSGGTNGGTSGGTTGGTTGGGTTGGGTTGNSGVAPRLIAPVSTSMVTSRRPLLSWDSPAEAIDLCLDRACSRSAGSATLDASGVTARPDAELPPGPVFWRVRRNGLASATWELFVGPVSAPVDSRYPGPLDLDGDGVPDSAAGVKGGGVAVYSGGLASAPLLLANPDDPKANFGYVVAAAGDLDGDGLGDLAVGECGKAQGRVHIYFGGRLDAAPQVLESPDGRSGFGCRVAGAGDLDGDGYADLAVARVGDDFGGGLYIYRGGAKGLPSTTVAIDSPDYKPSRLGYSLAGVGDLDGDGYADLAATEIDYSALSGRLHIYRGGPDGIGNQRVATIVSPDAMGLQYGASVASAGDFDGDGYPDIVLGAPAVMTSAGFPYMHIYFGGPSPGAQSTLLNVPDGGFGFEVEGGGDLDGDGFSDVVVTSNDGLVVFRGSTLHLLAPDRVDAKGQGANPRHAAFAGDLDGDGKCDFLVGDAAGVELLFGGGAAGLDRARVKSVTAPAGGFGGAVL